MKCLDDVLLCRIVANLLFKKINGIGITLTDSPLYDMIVEEKESNLFFGVKVGDMNYLNSSQYASYIETLKQKNYRVDEERFPIILMCVDKKTEKVKFGYQLTWQRFRATIQSRVTLRDITMENWHTMIENLKNMDEVIRVLSNDTIHVVKRIAVERRNSLGGRACADIIYLRKFTDLYKLRPKDVETEQEKYSRMINGISEAEYPNDMLDDVILECINQKFPDSKKTTKILLLNIDLQDLKEEIKRSQKKYS